MKIILIVLVFFGFTSQTEYINPNPIEITPIAQEREIPKLDFPKFIDINLTSEIISLWRNRQIIETLPIAYQSKEDVWRY